MVGSLKFCSRAFRERGRVTFCWAFFSLVTLCAAAPVAAAPRRRPGGRLAAAQETSRISGRLCLLGGAVASRPRGVRRRIGRSRSAEALYVQRVVSGRCAVRESWRPWISLFWPSLIPKRGGQHGSCHASRRPVYAPVSRRTRPRAFFSLVGQRAVPDAVPIAPQGDHRRPSRRLGTPPHSSQPGS